MTLTHKDLTDDIYARNLVEIDPSSRIDNLTLQFVGSGAELRIGPDCKLTGRIFLSAGAKGTIGARTIIHRAAFHMHEGGEVTGRFDKPNCILAGAPARVVRENVRWDY